MAARSVYRDSCKDPTVHFSSGKDLFSIKVVINRGTFKEGGTDFIQDELMQGIPDNKEQLLFDTEQVLSWTNTASGQSVKHFHAGMRT